MSNTKKQITEALKSANGNISAAAKQLGVPRTTLRDRIAGDSKLTEVLNKCKTTVEHRKDKSVVTKSSDKTKFKSVKEVAKEAGVDPELYEVAKVTYASGANNDVLKTELVKKDENLELLKQRAFEPVVYKPRKRPKVERNRDFKLWIVKADYHAPRGTDPELHDVSLEAMKELRPDAYIDLGDGSDFNALSRFAKSDMRWFSDFNEDILATRQILADNTAALSDEAEKHYVYGNHCFRYVRWLLNDAPPGFADVEDFQLENLLRLDTFGFKLAESETGPAYPYGEVELIPDVLAATHGDRCRKGGANSVRSLVETEGKSYLMGHVHDYGSTSVRIGKSIHYGFEVASMAKHDLGYARNPDHAQGFAVVVTWPDQTFMVEHAKWDPIRRALNFRDKQWKYKGC